MNVLAIGCHPDDIEAGCFGTLAKHAEKGDNIWSMILTSGERGGDGDSRSSECYEAAKLIGSNVILGNFEDGKLRDDIDTVSYIENFVKINSIDIIYTTSVNDRHQDHMNLAKAVTRAGRVVKSIYAYDTISTNNEFNPTLFVNISNTLGIKKQAIWKHESQSHRYYMRDASIELSAKYRGLKLGKPDEFYEAFEVIKLVRE